MICVILGYSRTTRFVYIPRSERSTVGKINIKTRLHNKPMILSCDGLRQILNGSKKPKAKDFKIWIKKEVMPTASVGYVKVMFFAHPLRELFLENTKFLVKATFQTARKTLVPQARN